MVTQVSGTKDYGNFEIFAPPKGRLLEEEFELCRKDNELKKGFCFEFKKTQFFTFKAK